MITYLDNFECVQLAAILNQYVKFNTDVPSMYLINNKKASNSSSLSNCRALFVGFTVLLLAIANVQTLHAQSEPADLTQEDWTRNTELLSLKADQYSSTSNELNIVLMAFPPTDKPAGVWIDEVTNAIAKKD